MTKHTTEISSITIGPRQSNIELLRIVAMFLVLVVHADFWILGEPTMQDILTTPLPSIVRYVLESISIVCVNTFILISGWFRIRPSVKGFCNFAFQCFFFLFGIYLICVFLRLDTLSFWGIRGCLVLLQHYWFIKSYVLLYIFSPVLNSFLNTASRSTIRWVLICFFIFQTIYGWSDAAKFFEQGYSTISFMGLYLFAAYLKDSESVNYKLGGAIYLISIVFNTILGLATVNIRQLDVYSYVNPFVIAGAVGLFMFFAGLNVKSSKTINWVAKSSFAVFLLHSNPNIGVPIFKKIVRHIYFSSDGIVCLAQILVFLIVVFITAIIFDQPRKWLWALISKRYF